MERRPGNFTEGRMARSRKPSRRQSGPAAWALANKLWAEGQLDDAVRKFNEAVRQAPNDPAVLIEAARALAKRYQSQRSEVLLARALRLAPRSVAVLQAVGETY